MNVSEPLPDGLSGLGIPELNASFRFYCRDSAACLIEGYTHGSREAGRLWVTDGPNDRRPTPDIPNPRSTNRICRDNPPPVRAEQRTVHFSLVSERLSDHLASLGIPEPGGLVPRRRYHKTAIGTERCPDDLLFVPQRAADRTLCLKLPDLRGRSDSHHNTGAIRTQPNHPGFVGDPPNRMSFTGLQSAGLQIPDAGLTV
jgi:hypothetical protein